MKRTAVSSHQTTSAVPSSVQASKSAASPSTSPWGTVGATDTRAATAVFTTEAHQLAATAGAAHAAATHRSPEVSPLGYQSRSRAEPCVSSAQESQVTLHAKRLATVAAPWAGSLSVGAAVGYSLPATRSLMSTRDKSTDDFRISDKEIFWFDSLLLLGAVFGSLCGCFVVHWLGRRRMMALGCLGSLASWLAVAAASADSFHLLTTRVLGGLFTGIVSLVVPAYIAEVSSASDRGKKFATTAVAAQLLDAVGRVKPLAVSVVVSVGSMLALGGVYFGVSHDEEALDTHIAARITVVCKVVFTIGFSLGLGPASWTLAVELAPLRKNGFEFGSVCAFHWATALGIISLFTILGTTTGSLALLVSLTGLVTFAGGMTAFKLLPDTRGVSLEGILLQGQDDVCSRKASDIVDAVKPADALPQVPKNDHEDQTATRDEQKTRLQRKDSAPHSSVVVSLKGSSKAKAKVQAKSHARPQAKAESKAKAEAKPQPEAGAKAGATEAVASGEDEVKSDVLSGATTAIVSPAKRAPGKQEFTEADEEG
ncbi:hypothetical protein HPB52_020940 [Rhipicephalus sanguineus]|uniref:Major facilitator superfamily (MFS) profile domain-containing protein n=1 Tax=Rhipicephalus sanguineus TaxID=34632 RepID=A0A9D4PXM7_RHISA|nr:hypothetical protein HPB52_020940 [Rhipicephalus sanguineus]